MRRRSGVVIGPWAVGWLLVVGSVTCPAAPAPASPNDLQPRVRQSDGRLRPDLPSLSEVAVDLPSMATGSPTGTLALSVHFPSIMRYVEGAPVVVWVHGGYDAGRLQPELPPEGNDLILITFLFPGGEDPAHGRFSDGVYDYRGLESILALRDVILFAGGRLADDRNRTIDDIVETAVAHNNVGVVGRSNSGNIITAVVTLYGDSIAEHLKYLIQWEPPLSSQIATRDLGRPLFVPGGGVQGEYGNPRRLGYGRLSIPVDYNDLAYDPSGPYYSVFHDGNGDGRYTTIARPEDGLPTPDLDLDGILELDEDFPLDSYPSADGMALYSRPVTRAMSDHGLFPGEWPNGIADLDEAVAYWDLREGVRLLSPALQRAPFLEGMIIASVRDHVQAAIDKPHIRQAFDAWTTSGGWVQINPSPGYLAAVDARLANHPDLPDNRANIPPDAWERPESYCVPESVTDETTLLAAVWQMADRSAIRIGLTRPARWMGAGPDDFSILTADGCLVPH